MMFKTIKIAMTSFVAIAAIIASVFVLPWALIFFGTLLLPNPPKPEIIYGEFPFRLVYAINGDTKVIEDTLICEYDRIGMDEGQGKFRKWKERLASGNQKILLLTSDSDIGLTLSYQRTTNQIIYYNPGPAWYYMGDDKNSGYRQNFPNASFSEQYQDGGGAEGIIQADELFQKYNIKLISWDHTPPIKNSFPSKK